MIFRWFSHPQRRTRALTVMAALVVAALAPRVYAQVRIGVVDVRRAVAETSEGRAAFDALKQRYDQRQADLDRRTKNIEGLKRRLEHPSTPIPQARLQKLVQQYQQDVMDLQQRGQAYTGELQAIEGELTKNILVKLQPLVREIGQSDNYQIIVDDQVVHFAPAHLNITDRVIQLYNQRFPVHGPVTLPDAGVPIAPPPAPGGPPPIGLPPPTPVPGPVVPPPVTSSDADAGHRVLPGVFYRRDAGH